MMKKQNIGINPHAANNNYRDQSLTGIGGPRVYVDWGGERLGGPGDGGMGLEKEIEILS